MSTTASATISSGDHDSEASFRTNITAIRSIMRPPSQPGDPAKRVTFADPVSEMGVPKPPPPKRNRRLEMTSNLAALGIGLPYGTTDGRLARIEEWIERQVAHEDDGGSQTSHGDSLVDGEEGFLSRRMALIVEMEDALSEREASLLQREVSVRKRESSVLGKETRLGMQQEVEEEKRGEGTCYAVKSKRKRWQPEPAGRYVQRLRLAMVSDVAKSFEAEALAACLETNGSNGVSEPHGHDPQ